MTNDPAADDRTPPGTPAEAGTSPGTGATSGASGEMPPPYGPPSPPYGPPPYDPPPYDPPPSGPGVAGRYGLVRPVHGRYVAGVCAAVARVTNTDPVLWRVLVAVLTLFGGIGLLLYLVGWLLMPAEGDSASPLEAMLGRGHSGTSPLNVVLITVLAALVFVFVISDGFRVAVLGVVAVIAALVLFGRQNPGRAGFGGGPPGPGFGAPGPDAPASGTPASGTPASGAPGWYAPSVPYASTSPAAGPAPSPAAGAPPPAPPPFPPSPTGGYPPPPPGGYRPPFAPRGPYASFPPPPVAPRPPQPPQPPKPPRQPSRLGRIVLSLLCVALGTVAMIDLTMGQVPASAYVAVALAVVGLGLLIGAWLGRARWLIAVGLVLTVALGVASVADSDRFGRYRRGPVVVWQPASLAELDSAYRADFGTATLDLRGVDFSTATQPVKVNVSMDMGSLQVLLPPDVDVNITANVDLGDLNVLGERRGGIGTPTRRVDDTGADGTGGGQLVLTASVDTGNLEVRR